MVEFIRQHLSQEELLCQLAEEASELAQAALKLRRTLSTVNPTPVSYGEAFDNLNEEIVDIKLLLKCLRLDGPNDRAEHVHIMQQKAARWVKRIKGKEEPSE